MNLTRFENDIRAFCTSHGDPKLVAKYARYFREGYDAYGVPQAIIERQREAWLTMYRESLGLEGFLKLGDCLMQTGKYEEASLAICFVKEFQEEWTKDTFHRMRAWLDNGIRNWAHSDFLCGEILRQFLLRKIVTTKDFAPWRSSTSRWTRRAVPVSLLAFVKQPEKTAALLKFLRPMMRDEERVVHQGLGWFLREAWKRNPKEVEPFLLEWKDISARLIFQYATEKMTPKQKMRYRAQK